VIKTGYQTTKGNLIREILYPKKSEFSFNKDTYFFVLFMSLIFVVFMGVLIPRLIELEYSKIYIVFKILDLLTAAIPPCLPAILTSCIMFSMKWLQQKQIFCTSPQRISVCGRVTTLVFDKTGTLTSDGLNIKGILSNGSDKILIEAMSLCHSLSKMKNSDQLFGDPMDIEIF
jgi:cation-transporting ATPase 13A2